MKKLSSIIFILIFSLTLVFGSISLTAKAAPALSTSGFHGANWADQRDNFVDDTLVLGGLSTSDSYATTQAKANAILTGLQNNLGVNTVRMPVNYPTVSGSYWNSYTGAIDMATSKGMNVILSYWEANSSRDGLVDNLSQFWSMWGTIVNKYGGNSRVYFEPMNEPHGYSDTDWKNLAAQWLTTYPNVPKGRIIISGAGYNQRIITIGDDSRFNGTLISRHDYAFFNNSLTTKAQWQADIKNSTGNYASRVIITEWGAAMTTGLNYNGAANDANHFIAFIQGVAAEANAEGLGTVYWPGVRIGDTYSMETLHGTGTNLTLTDNNASGRDQLRLSWGLSSSGPTPTPGPTPLPVTYYRLTNRNSNKVADVAGQATADGSRVKQYPWNGGNNQQWEFQDAGGGYFRIVGRQSGKCLDVVSASTADGAEVEIWTCNGGQNQQFQWAATGSYFNIKARHSGKCINIVGSSTADGALLEQRTCGTGNSFQWTRQ